MKKIRNPIHYFNTGENSLKNLNIYALLYPSYIIMSLPDQIQVLNGLAKDRRVVQFDSQYISQNFPFVQDLNNGSYQSNIITFNTSSFSSQFINFAESFLALPLNITSSTATAYTGSQISIDGASYTGGSGLAWKSSSLQLIQGVQVTSSNGNNWVNENFSCMMNSIRPLINSDMDFSNSAETLDYYSCDRNSGSGLYFGQVSVGKPTTNVYSSDINPTLTQRCLAIKNKARCPAGTISMTVFIPLRLITDMWKRMDFPLLNSSYLINFTLASGQTFQPMCYTNAAATKIAPSITIGSQSNSIVNYTASSARLYLKSVGLNANDTKLYRDLLDKEEDHLLEYITSTTYPFTSQALQTSGNVSINFTQNAVRPIRVWVMSSLSTTSITSANTLFPGGVCNDVTFQNTNLQINNQNYYTSPLLTRYDLYKIVQDQLPQITGDIQQAGPGSIGWNDFLLGASPLCFDLSRFVQPAVNCPLSLTFNSEYTTTSATNYDIFFIVEYINTVKIKQTVNGISSITSSGTVGN